ncbi:ubiquitin carboxyl-terminal hydrolase 42-like [Salminus brasiliensis]|uniref:ubiquitin carboxyl-terminal hydrolase 42-like n=1 Tax=Salminus brasiliensis TaxID=930266 RepID=UPI003B830D23
MDGTINTPDGCVELKWSYFIPVGAGLENVDSVCYANSVLQCLTYTPPLANYLLGGEHSRTCQERFCMMCTMEEHVWQVLANPGCVVQPDAVLSQLNLTGEQFRLGVAEDAHKFLKATVEAMEQSCSLNGQRVDASVLFEGRLQATTTCQSCGTRSNDVRSYKDITLSIEDVDSVRQALRRHFQSRTKSGYRCWKCQRTCQVSKDMALQDLSNVLVLRLKRVDRRRRKNTKYVRYPEVLNMRPFMAHPSGAPELYHLYGVLVHSGCSADNGHFFSHVKASDGRWYKMDDESVSSSESFLKQKAYLLFYIRSPNPAQKRDRDEDVQESSSARKRARNGATQSSSRLRRARTV